jgi:glyoxylase-like metal-dependent hydrolase (beta-lactamase superfamily II)
MGGLVFLSKKSNALIGIHELDAQTISHHEERLKLINFRLNQFLIEAGVGADERKNLLQMHKFTKSLFHSLPLNFTFEKIGMKFGPFGIIHLPGHCSGQVAIRIDDFIFCGDHILSRITPHQSPEKIMPYLGLGHYIESIRKFLQWSQDVKLILSGHDLPIENLRNRSETICRAIDLRLKQCIDFLVEPHSILEITHHLYGTMGGYNALLIYEKTGAYIEYLFQNGLLEITNLNELEETNQNSYLYRRVDEIAILEENLKERTYVFI